MYSPAREPGERLGSPKIQNGGLRSFSDINSLRNKSELENIRLSVKVPFHKEGKDLEHLTDPNKVLENGNAFQYYRVI